MASTYHPLYGGVWQSAKLEGTPFEEKGFFVYLFGNDHQRPSGIYRLTDEQAAVDTGLGLNKVRAYFADLHTRGAVVRDGAWLFVCGYFERQPKQDRLLLGAQRDVSECTSVSILESFGERYSHFNRWSADRLLKVTRRSGEGQETYKTTPVSQSSIRAVSEQIEKRHVGQARPCAPETQISTNGGAPERRECRAAAREVLAWLNEKAGRNYRPVATNIDLIVARLESGITAPQLKAIVSRKVREWNGDPKMRQYLRPETLFGKTKCEQYVGELPKLPKEDNAHA